MVTTNSQNYLPRDRRVECELGCQCAQPGQLTCSSYNYVYFELHSCFAQQVIYPVTVTSAFMLD